MLANVRHYHHPPYGDEDNNYQVVRNVIMILELELMSIIIVCANDNPFVGTINMRLIMKS